MGWFLQRKSTGRGKGKSLRGKKKASSTAPQWDPQRTLLAVKVIGSAAAVVLAVAGWYYGQSAWPNMPARITAARSRPRTWCSSMRPPG